MDETKKVYEQAVTTSRGAEYLAKKHGFESLADLVATLPESAKVIDVGAGASTLGKEAARLRPDITWINFDYSYFDPEILAEASADAPPNLELVAGDATTLLEDYSPEEFDAVFSYWLMPHLSLASDEAAQEAVTGMLNSAKEGAYVSIGPKVGRPKGRLPRLRGQDSIHFVKNDTYDLNNLANDIIQITKLKGRAIFFQKFSNEVLTPFFGTTRYAMRPEGKKTPHMFDPYSGEHISFLNPKSAKVVGGLAVASVKHISKARKSKLV